MQFWVGEFTLSAKGEAHWRELSARVSVLGGISGLLRIPDIGRLVPAYDLEVDPTVEFWSDGTYWTDGTGWESGFLPPYVVIDVAAARGDTSVVMRALPVSIERCLRMGDLFEIRPSGIPAEHGHLYEVANDVRTDADGKARVYFNPPLRAGVAAGDQVVLRAPMSVFRLAGDQEGIVNRDVNRHGRLGFTLIEELPR